jgi:plastocyanin
VVHRRVKFALAELGICAALLVALSIPATAQVAPGSAAYYNATIPATDGQLVAWINVVPVVCLPQGPQASLDAFVRVTGPESAGGTTHEEAGYLDYACENGTPHYGAEISNVRQTGIAVSPGDAVRFIFEFDAPSAPGQDVVIVQDKTSGASAKWKQNTSFGATAVLAGTLAGATGNIPQFSTMHYYNVTLNGRPLSTLPDLLSDNMVNTKGKIMVRTSGLSKNGEGFSTTFVRAG